MTIVSTAPTVQSDTLSIIEEFGGSSANNVEMMIGVGLAKDTEAVFFQYLGDEQKQAIMLPSGKPLTQMKAVQFTGISIAEEVGEFKSVKLNVFLTTSQGRTALITSGLTTIWSQCVLTGLMAVFNQTQLPATITLDSWYGTSRNRPAFAAIRFNNQKMSDNDLYEQLKDSRNDGDKARLEAICRDCVSILAHALGTDQPVQDAQVFEVDIPQTAVTANV